MNEDNNKWKEYSYSTDNFGQHYYFEHWERLNTGKTPRLALRKASHHDRDGILVVVGDHFNYVLGRDFQGNEKSYPQTSTLVDLVDAAVDAGDIATARSMLSIEAGHGRISKGWILDCAIPPWNEGKPVWDQAEVRVEGDSIDSCTVIWKGEHWDVFDSSFDSVQDLELFMEKRDSSHVDRMVENP
jgi:hypothetical protein